MLEGYGLVARPQAVNCVQRELIGACGKALDRSGRVAPLREPVAVERPSSFAVVTGVVEFWMLLVAGVLQGSAFGFYGPARVAFTTELVGRDQLGNAITLSLLSMNGTRVIAPSFAGALAGIAFFGIGGAYLVASAFSFLSFLAVLRLPKVASAEDLPPARPWAELVDGVRYVRARQSLRRLIVSSFVVIMFGFNYVVFIPALVKDTFELDNDGWVGLLTTASSVGAVAVGLWLAGRADSPGNWRVMVVTGVIFAGGVTALALSPTFLVAVLVVVVIGGTGSIKGAFVGAMLIGLVSTFGKVLLPEMASIMVYALMAVILLWRPQGLFGRAS